MGQRSYKAEHRANVVKLAEEMGAGAAANQLCTVYGRRFMHQLW